MPQTIYATFADPANAEKAAGALLDYGVRHEDISVVANENYQWNRSRADGTLDRGRLGGEAGGAVLERPTSFSSRSSVGSDYLTSPMVGDTTDIGETFTTTRGADTFVDNTERIDTTENAAKHGISTTTGADAAAGAAKGAGIGLGVGVLAGLAALAVPGVGTLFGAGLLASAIGTAVAGAVGTTAAGAIAGGVTGYLKDQGVEGPIADRYSQAIEGGGALLAVTLPSHNVDVVTGQALLEKYGATNVTNY